MSEISMNKLVYFNAMRIFLETYWESRGNGDEIRLLLSSMNSSFCADGLPLDRGLWDDWSEACAEAIAASKEQG